MANWKKSQNYKLRKKIENNKKKQVEDIANGKEPREFKMPETRRSTAADALDSYIARRAAREQVYGSETPTVTGSTRTPGDIMSEAVDRLRDRISMNKNGVGTSPVEARIPTAVPTTNRNRVSMANGAESVPRSFRNSNNGPMTVSRNAQNNPQSRIPRAQNYVGNVDINNRPIVELGNGQYATTETTFQERWKGDEDNGHYEIGHFATITKDGRKISDEEMNEYIDRVMSSDNPFETDKKGLNLLYKIDDKLTNGEYIRDNNLEQAFKEADDWDVEMHNLQDSMYKDQREKNNLSSVSRDLVNRVARNADNGVADITKKYAQQSVGPTDTSFLTDNLAAREASLRNAQRENTRLGQLAAEKYDRNRNAGKYADQYRQEENAQQYIDMARMPEDTGLEFNFGGKEGYIQAPRIIEMFTNPELDRARQIPTQYMTDEEKNIYRFAVGKYGQAEGTAYLKSIESELNRRLDEDLSGTMERASEKYPAFGAYANIAAGLPGGALGYAALAKNALGDEKIDPNDPALRAVKMREATQRGTQQGIKNQLGIEEDTKAATISDFLVGAGLSTANSLASAYLLPEPAVLAGFSGNAMADALDKTSTDDNSSQLQSTATAVAQGIAESFFEKFSLENLNAMRSMPVTSVKAFVKNFLKQSFVEGSEEFNTEMTNTITDLIINGDNSDIGQIYKSYLEAGADPKSALGASLMAKAKEAGIAFAGGFLSGGVSGTVGSFTGTIANGRDMSRTANNYTGNEQSYYSELAESIDTSTEEGAQAQAMAQYYADRVSRGERISLAENGYLGNAIDAAISASVERGSTVYESDDIQGTQQQVNDTVNAAVDVLKQERNIDTSESTPDEAKNLTEIAVNELESREMNDYVQKNVHNSVNSPAQNNDSVSVPRENEQENRLRELASDSINSNNVEKELERRATVRFKDDPDARTIYNAYFEDFADQLKNTNISTRDMVQMYDENMAKAYEAGRNGRAISTLDEDADYRMFDRAFPELTSAIWQMGNNKISNTNRELKNSFRDIYGTQGQSAFDTVVRADANFSDDVDAFNRIYNAGRYGKDIKEAGDLSRFGQRRSTEIYESGFKDSADEYDNFSKTVELFKKNPGRAEKGTFINATPRTSKDVRNVMKKFSDSVPFSFVIVDTNDQRSLDSALSQLQKRGLVENQATVESVFKSGSTGAVDTNRAFVVIDINTDNLLNTMGHELTHIAKVYDPEGYRAYSQAVLRKLADTEGYNLEGKIAYMQEQYKAQVGQELSRELAEEEIVAESAAFLNDEDVINELVSKDRTFAEKIRDWLRAVADMIKGLMDNATTRIEAKALRKDYQAYKNAAELWTKMIDAAADTYAGKVMNTAEMDSAIRNQLDLSEGMGSKVNVPGNPLTAEEIFSLDEEIMAKNDKYNEATRNAWKNIIEADDFVSLGFPHGEYMYYILSPSARTENKWQITHFDKDGPMSDERFKEGEEKRLYDVLESYTPRKGLDVTVVSVKDMVGSLPEQTRFQVKKPIEKTKNLIAVHNLSAEQLLNSLDMGGFPSPSIAVIKDSMSHTKYGDTTVMFYRETVDPKFIKKNKLYGGDAWTPTYPTIDYKVSMKELKNVAKRISELAGMNLDAFGYAEFDEDNVENALSGKGTLANSRYSDMPIVKLAYLKDSGVDVEPVYKEKALYNKLENAEIAKLSELLSDSDIEKYTSDWNYGYEHKEETEKVRKLVNEVVAESKKDLIESLRNEYEKTGKKFLKKNMEDFQNWFKEDNFRGDDLYALAKAVREYRENGNEKKVLDTYATRDRLNELMKGREDDYGEWINKLFGNIVEKKGIRNNKDQFLPSGNRRSWEALHDSVTLDNLTKAMNRRDAKGDAFFSVSGIKAIATKDFSSIDEAHKNENLLKEIDEEEYKKLQDEYSTRFTDIVKEILPESENEFIAFDRISDIIADTIRTKKTVKAIDTELRKWIDTVKPDTAQKLVDLMEDVSNMPTGYFEAKPQRSVYNNEIAEVITPNSGAFHDQLVEMMNRKGITYREYEAGNDEDRVAKVNDVLTDNPNIRFQITTDTSGRELSPEQSEYFADSKVVDDEGRLMVMYHGTPDGSFNTFRDGINFFTPNKEYATQYEHPSQSSRTAGKAAEAPKTYEVYLNITHPFDIRNEADRQRFVDDYVKGGWALGIDPYVPYKDTTKTGLPSWEEADNIYEWMEENDLLDEYDGILVDEGSTESGFDRGISYVTFNPNQIKSVDNENPTSTNDIRYQIGIPSEMFYTGYTGDIRSAQANIYLTNMLQASKDFTPSQNDIKKVVKELTDTYNSNMSKKELTRQLSELYTYMRTNEHVDGAQVTDTINAIARQVIREATFVDPQQQELWDNFRKAMKKTDIYVNPEFVRDIEPDGMNALRKRYFGRVNLTSNPAKSGNDGIRTYIQLQQEFPEIFTKHVDDITSDADAINEILYGFEKARPKEMSVFGNASTEEEATADLAQRIMDAYFEVGNESVKTQYQKTYKQLREEMKDDIIREYTDSLRAIEISDSEKLAQLRSAYTAGDISADTFVVSRAALEDYKRQQDQAARDLFRVKRDKYVDRIQRNKYKDDIIKTSKQLAKMIITPTDKQHIPTEMVKPISNVLQYIDFSSNRVNPDGSLTKRTVESDEFHKSIDNILNILRKIENNDSVYENNGKTAYLVIDPDLMQNLHELSDSFANNDEVKDNIDNLSTQNLRTVQQTLRALKQMVNNANRFISMERYNTVSDLATQSISDFEQSILNRGKLRQGIDKAKRMSLIKTADDILDSGMLDAYTYFYGLGDTGLELYNNVREGLNRQIRNTDTAIKYMEDTMERNDVSVKDRNKWENDLIEVELNAIPIGGTLPVKTKVKLSAAQLMSLYLLNKRGQARMHLYGNTLSNKPQNGGFVLEPSGKNAIEMDDKHVFKVTEADVDELVSKLTPQQKAVADDIGRFLTEVTSKWGNEVTQKLYGYNKFEAKNYFPIKVDNSTIATTSASLERNGVAMLKNIGQTKTVQQRAYNPLTLQNIFDVYTAQAEDMGNYNAYVAPTADLQMWINYKGKEGNVKRALTNAYGEKASQYFMNLMRDINQPRANTDKWDKLIGSFMGLQRAGAIWGNLRVAVQQPFAYTRAAAVMDTKYLLQGLTLNPAKQAEEWELAKKYAPIAQWKDYGFFDIGVGPSMKRVILGNDTLMDKVADLGMQPASMGDTIAWVRLWYASQAQVKDQHPELEVGSEEFYEKAGKIFSHVVDATQVVDSVLHRSDIMKSKNTAVKGATAFLSEPTKTYNMLFRALYDFVNADNKNRGKMGQKLIGTLTVWAISQAVNSAVASLISALRYHDKDKDLKEKYIERVIPDFLEAMQIWNSIPIVRDILSAAFGGETDESSNYELLSLIPKLASELIKVSKGESKKGPWGILYQASQLSTFWGGNNLQNPLRDIDGIIDNLIIGDDMRKYYPYQKAKYNMYAVNSNGSYTNLKMFVATAMKAYAKGDTELGDMIVRDLKKKIPEEKIDNIFANALKEEEGIKTLARASLDGNEQQAAAARSELLSKGYSEEMIDKKLDSAFQEIVGSSEDIATSFVEKSEGWEDQLREFANYKTLQGKNKKEIRSSLKNAVTKAYADDYRAENAAGKKDIKNKLLSLSYDGEKLYSESDFTKKNSTWNKH